MPNLKVYLVMAIDDPYMLPYVEEIFASKELAESHLAHLQAQSPYTTYLIEDWDVLDSLPADEQDFASEGTSISHEGES
ncbi:hypothetical protein ANRL1_01001 [Anaerolineae bacterium]|nr:hypothetical protein ANRL1_01001 [Anaerolineae bacterium]